MPYRLAKPYKTLCFIFFSRCHMTPTCLAEHPLPQLASTPLPGSSSLLRKRGRLDHIPETSSFDPTASSGLLPLSRPPIPAELPAIASCPDHILDSLAAMESQAAPDTCDASQLSTLRLQPMSTDAPQATAGIAFDLNSAGNSLHNPLATAANGMMVGSSQQSDVGGESQPGGSGRTGCNPLSLVAAAKQAAVVLEQNWHKREQHLAVCAQRWAKHKQRYLLFICSYTLCLRSNPVTCAQTKRLKQPACYAPMHPQLSHQTSCALYKRAAHMLTLPCNLPMS